LALKGIAVIRCNKKILRICPFGRVVKNSDWVLQRREVEAVKAERSRLLEQLAQVKTDPGKAGGDLQEADILNLRHEVEVKKAKLNELHEVPPPPSPPILYHIHSKRSSIQYRAFKLLCSGSSYHSHL
jgi:hypothetical protein